MKVNVKISYLMFLVICCCGTIGINTGYTDWDANGNGQLTRYEFVRGYQMSNYFFKWNKAKEIDESQFYNTVYKTMDQNQDSLLTCHEFENQIDYFYRKRFLQSCSEWDDNRDNLLSKDEFTTHGKKTTLFSAWDTSKDKKISEREMARGMFALCDLDNDGRVSIVEFNIWNANR